MGGVERSPLDLDLRWELWLNWVVAESYWPCFLITLEIAASEYALAGTTEGPASLGTQRERVDCGMAGDLAPTAATTAPQGALRPTVRTAARSLGT